MKATLEEREAHTAGRFGTETRCDARIKLIDEQLELVSEIGSGQSQGSLRANTRYTGKIGALI